MAYRRSRTDQVHAAKLVLVVLPVCHTRILPLTFSVVDRIVTERHTLSPPTHAVHSVVFDALAMEDSESDALGVQLVAVHRGGESGLFAPSYEERRGAGYPALRVLECVDPVLQLT